ncbi:MAG: DUF4197 domain-containing protein [Flavobacteriaceae bacterium]
MKKIILVLTLIVVSSCAELNQVVNQMPNPTLSNAQIAGGLKEALQNGITNQVSFLALKDGFYKNDLVKIPMPSELQNLENTLRKVGLGKLADDGIKMLNRAAEDAVKEATPIFVNAIKSLTVTDAKNILLGNQNAATDFLQNATKTALFAKFEPVIKNSFAEVGADVIWSNLITKYNAIPLTRNVNPDLTNYVTSQALNSVFKMVAKEELKIRTDIKSRTSKILQDVFKLQDRF